MEVEAQGAAKPKLRFKECAEELRTLQEELVALQEWLKKTGERVIVVFEGRGAAGKGGVIENGITLLIRVLPALGLRRSILA